MVHDAALTTHVGSGNNLTLATPGATTTYYVRFEGDCNTTAAQSVTVNIKDISVAPASATVDHNDLCPSTGNIVLSVTQAEPRHQCHGRVVQRCQPSQPMWAPGNNLTLATPGATTTYYVRFEGDCNTTAAQSVTVNIKDISVAPASATVDHNDLCPATGNIVLSVTPAEPLAPMPRQNGTAMRPSQPMLAPATT